MKLASREGVGALEKAAFRWFRLKKRLRQRFRYGRGQDKTVLLVVGCQRSGTSMIHHLFRLDCDCVTYDEVSPLSSQDQEEELRWNPWPEVQRRILADRAPFVACKPLVESHNMVPLLALFPRSRALWMYRDFHDVVLSNLEYFGDQTGHLDLHPIVTGDTDNWRAAGLGEEALTAIRGLYRPDLPAADAAALFWYARNSLFFSLELGTDERVALCRYGDLVTRPAEVMVAAYRFLGRTYPGDRIVADVFSGSRGRGRSLSLTPAVEQLCAGMMRHLDARPRLGRQFPR